MTKEFKEILNCFPQTEIEQYLDERKGREVV